LSPSHDMSMADITQEGERRNERKEERKWEGEKNGRRNGKKGFFEGKAKVEINDKISRS
jgi:hypothetical protein